MSRAAPTPLLAALVAAAGAPLLADGWAWLSWALTACLAVAALSDLLLSGRRIEARRVCPPTLSLGAENAVRLEVRGAGAPVRLELKDDLPRDFQLSGSWPVVSIGGHNRVAAEYRVRPTARGQYTLGPLHGRYLSPLRLWRRQVTWVPTDSVRVYPNLVAARQWEVAIRRGRRMEGLKRTRLRGAGTEFESLREYQPGDPYRAINWPATARRGKPVTTLYQVDRSRPIMLLIDAGRIMIPHMKGMAKLDHALNAALLLATVAVERGDQTGLMLFGAGVKRFMAPRKGRGQVLAMMEALYDVAPEQVEPDYAEVLGWFRTKHKKRSLVVLFTDLIDPETSKSLVENLAALAGHHLVLLVSLSDPDLLRISRMLPASSREVYQKATAADVLARKAETKAMLRRRGIFVIDVLPEEFSATVVNQYLLIKEQGRL